jgi:septum formation protein
MSFLEKLGQFHVILGSQSPRRQYLLKELGVKYDVKLKQMAEENYPDNLVKKEIPLYLANQKAAAFDDEMDARTLVITADTIVWLDNEVIHKPKNNTEAYEILRKLSGKVHQVYTGVCLRTLNQKTAFSSQTDVYFKELTDKEIWYYIDKYEPFDKAGAYGIQEWLGYIGVEKIEGSFFNVMGLPVQKLYVEIQKLIDNL